MKKGYKLPPYRLISSAVDGNEQSIERYWHFMTRTYQNAVCVLCMMNTVMFIS